MVSLDMELGYPNLNSGWVSFENLRTGEEVNFKFPSDIEKNKAEISSITIDSGASLTLLPRSIVDRLGIPRPDEDEEAYTILRGCPGISVGFRSPDPIRIEIGDEDDSVGKEVFPLALEKTSPSVFTEPEVLQEYKPHSEMVIPFVSPSVSGETYRVEIESPSQSWPQLERRLKLYVETGEGIDFVLIGRDWQDGFDVIFGSETIEIIE